MKIFVILGPTATNKSETAYQLAKKINAEIINGDAFQIYRELNIGVAKPNENYFKEVPHHLYSFVSISDEYSPFQYQKDLRECLAKLAKKNKNAIIVGGSLNYIRSGLYDYEFNEEKVKEELIEELQSLSNIELLNKLKEIDPLEAEKIHLNNRKRLIRALTICFSSGSTKTSILAKQNHQPIYRDIYFFAPLFERDDLYNRANERVDQMINSGLIEEVKNLYLNYPSSLRAFQAIGYKELFNAFDLDGDINVAIELIKRHTRNYIKRQYTYLNHQFSSLHYYNSVDDIFNFYLGLENE